MRRKRYLGQGGFTLIELMIAVAIVGILVALAVPAYESYMVRTRRADAQGALNGVANALERYHTQNGTYVGAALGAGGIHPDQSPIEGTPKAYNLTIPTATGGTYTVRATPIGPQVGDGYLELTHTGARRWDRNNDGDTDDTDETSWDR